MKSDSAGVLFQLFKTDNGPLFFSCQKHGRHEPLKKAKQLFKGCFKYVWFPLHTFHNITDGINKIGKYLTLSLFLLTMSFDKFRI